MRSPELAVELRTARPTASPELRSRVHAVAAREQPARAPRFSLPPLRRVALAGAAMFVAAGVAGAVVHGIVSPGRSPRQPNVLAARGAKAHAGSSTGQGQLRGLNAQTPANKLPSTPAQARLQQYGAGMRIQVANLNALSEATKQAMRFARLVGGYVAYVRYSSPAHDRGVASLIVRVPIDRVQDVIAEYSDLGTILSQQVSVLDVTKAVEEQAREIARLKAEISRLESGGVRPAERARLDALQARLDYLTKRKAATVRRAEFARVGLELTTKQPAAAAASSRFDRTLGDAGGVLLREAEILLYALVVAGPLLLVGAAIVGAGRLRDRRLWQRT